MKTRHFAFILAAAICLSGCGSSTSTATGTANIEESAAQTEDVKDLADMMDVQEYTCTVDDSFVYYVMYITNNSDTAVSIEMNVTALDSSGGMVGSSSDSTRAVDVGQTAGIWTTFDDWDKISSFEYTLTASEETDYSPVYNDLDVEYNTTDDGIVAKVTNNSEDNASFVWMDVVYLKGGEMVNFSELSFMNDNQELPAGTSLSVEGECYYDGGFDDVVIAVNGRK